MSDLIEPLTQKYLKEVLHYEPDSGVFVWKVSLSTKTKIGSAAGHKNRTHNGRAYLVIKLRKRKYYAHRLAFLYMTGKFPESQCDHIDGDELNNAWANLRDVTGPENMKNARLRKNNSSGACGVVARGPGWLSQIGVNNKMIHLGSFPDKEDAIAARKSAERRYGFHKNHGEARS